MLPAVVGEGPIYAQWATFRPSQFESSPTYKHTMRRRSILYDALSHWLGLGLGLVSMHEHGDQDVTVIDLVKC